MSIEEEFRISEIENEKLRGISIENKFNTLSQLKLMKIATNFLNFNTKNFFLPGNFT